MKNIEYNKSKMWLSIKTSEKILIELRQQGIICNRERKTGKNSEEVTE